MPGHAKHLSVLSDKPTLPKWSFSTGARKTFMDEAERAAMRNCSTMTASTSCPDFSSKSFSQSFKGEDENEHDGLTFQDSTWTLGSSPQSTAGASPARRSGEHLPKVPRFDGSSDRFLDLGPHSGMPSTEYYDPAPALGKNTSPALTKAPLFSFGGGKPGSRLVDGQQEKMKKLTKVMAKTSSADEASLGNRRDNRGSPRRRVKMCRGFGTEERKYFGSANGVPGPGSYGVHREMDPVPDWAPSSLCPWGVRSAERPDLINPTATDAGPGEYSASHPFQASASSPIIGVKLRERTDTRLGFPDPTRYEHGTTIGTGPTVRVSKGARDSIFQPTPGPGPAYYGGPGGPPDDATLKDVHACTFGGSVRLHPASVVDPEEPPGPGAYALGSTLRQQDFSGWPIEEKLKKMGGMGPVGFPSPGDYQPRFPSGKEITCHLPIERPIENIPACTDYSPTDHLLWATAPACGPLRRTAPRKTVFDMSASGTEEQADQIRQRVMSSVKEALGPVQQANPVDRMQQSGPSWSMQSRKPQKAKQASQTMTTSFSSFG